MIQIALPPAAEELLRRRAETCGETVDAHAARLLQEALAAPRIDELLRPLRQQVAESGISDAEFDTLAEELREEVWRERESKRANGR
jgi:hypothetical protein